MTLFILTVAKLGVVFGLLYMAVVIGWMALRVARDVLVACVLAVLTPILDDAEEERAELAANCHPYAQKVLR